ncbi:hypothetical protein RUM43_001622 [Polyplax serrata]|uniref:Uncharacterized protein n=1 Tax=Polyplax serrata TaxID=468196 RepID=A0AAN8SIM7_POLSC
MLREQLLRLKVETSALPVRISEMVRHKFSNSQTRLENKNIPIGVSVRLGKRNLTVDRFQFRGGLCNSYKSSASAREQLSELCNGRQKFLQEKKKRSKSMTCTKTVELASVRENEECQVDKSWEN